MINNPTYRGAVHPWHCDHMGHMNVMHYVGKFDDASWNFFTEVGLTPQRMKVSDTGVATVQQNISHARELFPGDTVVVNRKVLEVQDRTLCFAHEMLHAETGEFCATSEYVVVHMDHEMHRAAPIPDDIRKERLAAPEAGR